MITDKISSPNFNNIGLEKKLRDISFGIRDSYMIRDNQVLQPRFHVFEYDFTKQ